MLRADCVLSAHTGLDRVRAEAAVLQWFEEWSLELEYGSADRWIAWIDGGLSAGDGEEPELSVEVQLYPLEGAGTQLRWQFRGARQGSDRCLLRDLARALHARLRRDPLWGIDLCCWDGLAWDGSPGDPAPWDGPDGDAAAGAPP